MNQAAAHGSGSCPVCGGTGWEVYDATVFDYGDPIVLPFARKCTKCTAARRGADKTGVPDQFHDADYMKFDFHAYRVDMTSIKKLCLSFVKQFDVWETSGKGLYVWSQTPGSGKTFLVSCLAKSVMMKQDLQMRFVTAPDYLSYVGDSYKRERGLEDESEVYRTCRLLVLDDIGTQKEGGWQEQELFRLINKRMENGVVTLFTSNLPPEQLNLSDRTKDRIIKQSVVLQMPEESIRRKRATQEQNDFLKKILA